MSKVISMHTSVEYQEHPADIKRTLKKMESKLFVHAANLCSCSGWRNWYDSMEVGEEFEFDTDMLSEGDKNAALLVEMMEHLHHLRKELK